MNNTPSIHAYGRKVLTPFGLLGMDENALSFALGYTLQQCPELLQWFLKEIGIFGIRRSSLNKVRIDLQRHRSGDGKAGITDIEIYLPGQFHIIIEAKVGLGVPSFEQCRKYLPRFDGMPEPCQILVALVESPVQSFVDEYSKQDSKLKRRLVGFHWSQLIPECIRLMHGKSTPKQTKEWVRHLYDFMDQEFDMKAFTTEVWLLSVNTKPLWPNGLTFWDIHQKYQVYFHEKHPTVRPLYIAFRVDGVVDSIYRILRIEHSVPSIKVAPELVHLKEDWPNRPYTIWHFSSAIPLPNPLRTGSGMYNRHVRCDLDLLLTCKTVQEVEVEMGNRRSE
jgi:hypothetical protein